MQDKCFELTTLLSIQSKRVKILELFLEVCPILNFGMGKKGYIALAACTLIIIRQDKVPLTIANVYKCLSQEYGPIHYKDLGKMFSSIVSTLKLELPLSDFYCYFEKCIHLIPTSDRCQFIIRSQSLAEFGEMCGLNTGKSKASICIVVVLLALEAETGSKPSKDIILDTCDLLSVSKRQVMNRRREFVQRLIEYGRQWPCFDDLDTKNFSTLVGILTDWGSARGWKHEITFNPPAFQKSVAHCTQTLERITAVKRMIDQQNMSLLSDKDLLIAEYIQAGCSNQEIVDYNPLFRKRKKKT
jgi:hypothetical protein